MTQEELEHLLHARAGPRGPLNVFQFTEETQTVDVPADPNAIDAKPTKRQVPVRTWTDPGTGQVVKVQVNPDGTYTKLFDGIDEKAKGEPATTPAQAAKDEQGTEIGSEQTTDAQGKTVKRTTYRRADGTTYTREDTVQAAPEKPQPGKPYQNAEGQWVTPVVGPDGTVTTKPLPPEAIPRTPSEPVSAPSDQKWTVARRPDGTYEQVLNPNYVKPSRIMADPADPTKLINVTHDDNGNVIAEPVTGTTVIKPADLPVLQAKFGQLGESLGRLAQELNSRYARGEITEKQKHEAFTAAHQQAQTQVSEINSILENSRAIWSGEINQRGQSLGETQSRRGFAQNVMTNAISTGMTAAATAGKGAGKDIVGGIAAMMGMGQRYADQLGGMRESPEVPLPAALQQARGIGLPGFGPSDGGAGAGTPVAPPAGGPNALGLGAIGAVPAPGGPPPREMTPAIGGPPQPLPERNGVPVTSTPAVPPGLSDPGFHMSPPGGTPGLSDPGFDMSPPGLQGMGEALQGSAGFGGSPVAAGGLGMYDPTADVQSMIGDGADPDWALAVQQAAQQSTQPGYAWQRFGQPASRFG